MSVIVQGITLEIMGDVDSMGSLTGSLKVYAEKSRGNIKYEVTLNTLGEWYDFLEKRGVSTNIALFLDDSSMTAMEPSSAKHRKTSYLQI